MHETHRDSVAGVQSVAGETFRRSPTPEWMDLNSGYFADIAKEVEIDLAQQELAEQQGTQGSGAATARQTRRRKKLRGPLPVSARRPSARDPGLALATTLPRAPPADSPGSRSASRSISSVTTASRRRSTATSVSGSASRPPSQSESFREFSDFASDVGSEEYEQLFVRSDTPSEG